MAQILLKIAFSFREQGLFNRALQYYDRALTIAEEIESNYEIRDAYEGLTHTYTELSDFQNALKYSTLLNSINNTIYSTETDDKVRNLMFSHEINKIQNQIELYRHKK